MQSIRLHTARMICTDTDVLDSVSGYMDTVVQCTVCAVMPPGRPGVLASLAGQPGGWVGGCSVFQYVV